MRQFLLRNSFKIIIIAAVVDVLAAFLNQFAVRIIDRLEITINYGQTLGDWVFFYNVAATIFFWLAFAAAVAHLEVIYRGRPEPGPENRAE
jgi:hypothetical protein